LPEATDCFRRVLTIDPIHALGCQALAEALRRQAKPGEGLRYAQRAARLTKFQNADVLLTLAEINADAGKFEEADAAAGQALEAARVNDPPLAPQIRERREAIRKRANQATK
jgi:tetratricopeptide (TPR) repeat protein